MSLSLARTTAFLVLVYADEELIPIAALIHSRLSFIEPTHLGADRRDWIFNSLREDLP